MRELGEEEEYKDRDEEHEMNNTNKNLSALNLSKGQKVFFMYPLREGPGYLVEIIKANTIPETEKVWKYYGRFAPVGAFKAAKVDRYVFVREQEPDNFLIMPDSSSAAKCLQMLVPMC